MNAVIEEIKTDNFIYRDNILEQDAETVRSIVSSTGLFNGEEVDIAVELVEERIRRGARSGYYFHFACRDSQVLGFSCLGPIPGSYRRFEIYWIAVDALYQGMGIGKTLIQKSEQTIRDMGGVKVYIESSSREEYGPAHAFYQNRGYVKISTLKDYYSIGDSKVIFMKSLIDEGF